MLWNSSRCLPVVVFLAGSISSFIYMFALPTVCDLAGFWENLPMWHVWADERCGEYPDLLCGYLVDYALHGAIVAEQSKHGTESFDSLAKIIRLNIDEDMQNHVFENQPINEHTLRKFLESWRQKEKNKKQKPFQHSVTAYLSQLPDVGAILSLMELCLRVLSESMLQQKTMTKGTVWRWFLNTRWIIIMLMGFGRLGTLSFAGLIRYRNRASEDHAAAFKEYFQLERSIHAPMSTVGGVMTLLLALVDSCGVVVGLWRPRVHKVWPVLVAVAVLAMLIAQVFLFTTFLATWNAMFEWVSVALLLLWQVSLALMWMLGYAPLPIEETSEEPSDVQDDMADNQVPQFIELGNVDSSMSRTSSLSRLRFDSRIIAPAMTLKARVVIGALVVWLCLCLLARSMMDQWSQPEVQIYDD